MTNIHTSQISNIRFKYLMTNIWEWQVSNIWNEYLIGIYRNLMNGYKSEMADDKVEHKNLY